MFREIFCGCSMYLVYLDDGGKDAVKVFGGIVVPDSSFSLLETASAVIVANLLPAERRETFDEFHASDLFNGTGVFQGLLEERRHGALRELLQLRNHLHITYVYSAVDTKALNNSPLRSASWLDTAFFMCACAIDQHLRSRHYQSVMRFLNFDAAKLPPGSMNVMPESLLSLMIVDEPGQVKDKERIKHSFRSIRQPLAIALQPTDETATLGKECRLVSSLNSRPFQWSNRLVAPVDQVLFGSSADSIGLQLADACNWVMWKHLCGENPGELYEDLVKGPIICAKPEPEWTQYRHLFRSHE
jgi:hypothetical protein